MRRLHGPAPDRRRDDSTGFGDRCAPSRPDSIAIRRRIEREVVYLQAPVELDVATVAEFAERLEEIGPDEDVIIDLRPVEFCGAAGLNALVHAYQRTRALGSTLTLSHPPPHLDRLLSITGLDETLPIRRPVTTRRRRLAGTDGNRR